MALRTIIDIRNDERLRKRSKEVRVFDESLDELLNDMRESMRKFDGCGLAAIQVGVFKRVIIVEADGIYLELINPEIISSSGKQVGQEGCLSVEGRTGLVERPEKLKVKAYTKSGDEIIIESTGFLSVVLSHEIDHLDGVLFIDKIIEEDEK